MLLFDMVRQAEMSSPGGFALLLYNCISTAYFSFDFSYMS